MIIVKNKQRLKNWDIFDQFGNEIKRMYYDGDVTIREYDQFGNEIKMIYCDDAYTYEYDKFGKHLKTINPDGKVYDFSDGKVYNF